MNSTVAIGTKLGDFEIIGQLGVGAAGIVYRAKHVVTCQEVALKVMAPSSIENEEIHSRFIREITVASKLEHENIVAYHDCSFHEHILYYTMEIVTWGTLAEVLSRRRSIDWREAAECGIHICRGLQHLHQNRIVHRDLKPANIFLSDDGRLKLGDFGLARDSDSSRLTTPGKTVGTAKYLAPEQAMAKDIDGRTDLYALGCILFEMIAGRPPFLHDGASGPGNYFQLMKKHVEVAPPRVTDFVPGCPLALAELINQLLAKKLSDRPSSAEEVAGLLQRMLDDPQSTLTHANLAEKAIQAQDISLTERLQQSMELDRKVNVKALITVGILALLGLAMLLISQRST